MQQNFCNNWLLYLKKTYAEIHIEDNLTFVYKLKDNENNIFNVGFN